MLALYGIFTCKLQNHSTVVLNNMLQYYKKTNIHILTLRNSYKVKEHVLGHLLSGLFRSYCNPSLTVSRLFIRNSNYYIVRQNGLTPRQFGTNVLISINKEKCQLLLTSVVNRTALWVRLSGLLLYIFKTREYCDVIKILSHTHFPWSLKSICNSTLMTSHYFF